MDKFTGRRVQVLKVVFLTVFVVFVGRLFQLQVLEGDSYLEQANFQQQRKSVIPARRGKILVKKNRYTDELTPLATNNTLQKVFVDPLVLNYPKYSAKIPFEQQERGNPNLAAEVLAPILINSHCEKIEGCVIETDVNKLSDTQKTAIKAYEKELWKVFEEIYRRNVVLMTDLSETNAEKIREINVMGIVVTDGRVVADPLLISNPELTAEKLAPLLGIDEKRLAMLLQKSFRRYEVISAEVVPEVAEKIREFKGITEYKDVLRGIGLEDKYKRFYPEKELASSVIGFLDSKGVGQYGIEGHFDQTLHGQEGVIRGATSVSGQRVLSNGLDIQRAKDGADVVLAIDRLIQGEVEQQLRDGLDRFQADSAQAIVVDPKTGKILAMANEPSFNPNNFGEVFTRYEITKEQKDSDEENEEFNQRVPTIREGDDYYRYYNKWGPEVFRNKVVTDEYEPGSVIKAMTMAGAINAEEVTPQTTYQDNAPVEVDEFVIRNSDEVYSGETTMIDVINRSLNTGIAFITQKMGARLLYDTLKNFGFGEYSDIKLSGEAQGKLEFWQDWQASELVTRGFGQGFTASPLQVAMAFSVIANGGYLMKPVLVEEIRENNEVIEKNDPERLRRVVSAQTAETLKAMLSSAVHSAEGTGRGARVYGYKIGGKTGTSQTYKNGKAQSGLGTTIASFAGFLPYDNPQFVMLVKYDHPKTSQWGSETAATTFREISSFLFEYAKIPPSY